MDLIEIIEKSCRACPPFVYLATLARTGSTMLGEALTRLPGAFIFFEPHLGKNYFSLNEVDAKRFSQYGIDLRAFFRWRLRAAFIIRRFRLAAS